MTRDFSRDDLTHCYHLAYGIRRATCMGVGGIDMTPV